MRIKLMIYSTDQGNQPHHQGGVIQVSREPSDTGDRVGRHPMVVGFANPVHCEVNLMQHYVIKFVSDLRQLSSFLLVLRFSPPIKLTATKELKYC